MENNDKEIKSAYQALLGTIFGNTKSLSENKINERRRSIWLHENFTDDEIWEIFDLVKWEQEFKSEEK